MPNRKRPLKFLLRVGKLYFSNQNRTGALVQQSYDRISSSYDDTWTHHMRDLTSELIDKLDIQKGQTAIDLACGTGFATGIVAQRTSRRTVGIDQSSGMLDQARRNYSAQCEFVQSDVLTYLRALAPESMDVVTCCWGLGYSKPLAVLREISRVLRKGGKVGIIDNTLFSLREVMYCSALAFMEEPERLENLMKFRFLTGRRQLRLWMRLAKLKPAKAWGASKSYTVGGGKAAIEKLRATGAAAGFEYAANESESEAVFMRFAEIMEQKYKRNGSIAIIHRYAGGIGVK